jgi:hypothetical protein
MADPEPKKKVRYHARYYSSHRDDIIKTGCEFYKKNKDARDELLENIWDRIDEETRKELLHYLVNKYPNLTYHYVKSHNMIKEK